MNWMDDCGIGPTVYGAFYIIGRSYYHQYYLMQLYTSNCKIPLINKKLDLKTKQHIVKEMINILHRQIFDYGLYCSDTKPHNFVYDADTGDVKMIDFGTNTCSEKTN